MSAHVEKLRTMGGQRLPFVIHDPDRCPACGQTPSLHLANGSRRRQFFACRCSEGEMGWNRRSAVLGWNLARHRRPTAGGWPASFCEHIYTEEVAEIERRAMAEEVAP